MEYGFSGDDFVRGPVLGLTLDTGRATVLGFWKNFTYFLRRRGLGFWCFFFCRMEKYAQSMLRFEPLHALFAEYRHHFYELTSWILCDDVGHFSFQFIARVCRHSSSHQRRDAFSVGMAAVWQFFRIFRAPPGCLELSASFRNPRWRRVLRHRGPLHNFFFRVFVDTRIPSERSR